MIKRALLLALVCAAPSQAQTPDSEQYQAKLEQLQKLIEQLQTDLKSVSDSKDTLNDELSASEKEIGELTKSIQALEQELTEQKKQLALLHEQRASLKLQQRDQFQALKGQLISAFAQGQNSSLKTLLNIEQTQQLARVMRYHEYIAQARSDQIERYRTTIGQLTNTEQALISAQAQLEQQQVRLKTQQASIETANKSRQQTLAKLQAREQTTAQALNTALSEREELERLLSEVTALLADIPIEYDQTPFVETKGKLQWPTQGQVKHRFGRPKVGNKLTWDGIHISAKEGAPVQAVHAGRVVYSDWLRGQGLLIIVDHGQGYLSLYSHNQTLLKEVGEWVAPAEVIATVGRTGGLSQAGLYLEIRHNSKPLNPESWLGG